MKIDELVDGTKEHEDQGHHDGVLQHTGGVPDNRPLQSWQHVMGESPGQHEQEHDHSGHEVGVFPEAHADERTGVQDPAVQGKRGGQ